MKQMKNNILFEIPNFFSEKECRYSAQLVSCLPYCACLANSSDAVIAESERIGFSGIEWEYTPDYRCGAAR